MAKKRRVARKSSSSSSQYRHFRLHGDHSMQKLLVYLAIDVAISTAVGLFIYNQFLASFVR